MPPLSKIALPYINQIDSACESQLLSGGIALSVPSATVGPHTVLYSPHCTKRTQIHSSRSLFPLSLQISISSFVKNMMLPLGWALNPLLMPSFVPSTSNMQERRSSDSGDSLPDYSAVDETTPPAYRLAPTPSSETLARPKEVHTHLPRDETRAGASSPELVDDYVHMQNGLNFDVEANMAAANVRGCPC
jgi:hypothetical protein